LVLSTPQILASGKESVGYLIWEHVWSQMITNTFLRRSVTN